MLQILRVYLLVHAIKIKWIMCLQVKIAYSSMSQEPRLRSAKISGDFSGTTKIKQH